MAGLVLYHAIFALAISFSAFFLLQAEQNGFHIDLIHRDSPNSPFYNALETPSQRLINTFQRSIRRASHFKASLISPQSSIISNHGEYLMEISIGTPPLKIFGIADTGSDLIWTQCKPCIHCFDQEDPLFNPKDSSTFQEIPCYSKLCQSQGGGGSCLSDSNETCHYSVYYGDGSFTKGILGWETVLLGSISFPKTVFGCGYHNSGSFDKKGSGIIGLGRGTGSLISRTDSYIGGKFSHCLVPIFSETGNTSKLNFGYKAIVSGPEVVSTPLIFKESYVFYFLTLEAISVGNERLEFKNPNLPPNNVSKEGNTIIDSGTTLTMLPEAFYIQVESAVSKAILDLKRVYDHPFLPLCYETKSDDDDFGAPIITVHFTAGADVQLHQMNSFIRLSEDLVCFAFVPTGNFPFSIFGNLAQMNFLVGYDLEQMTVSFKQADCTQL